MLSLKSVLVTLFSATLVSAAHDSPSRLERHARAARAQTSFPQSATGSSEYDIFGPTTLSPFTDPFYKHPAGWENTALGTVLRTRQIKWYPTGNGTAWQLLYRTQSGNGTAMATVTTVWKPAGAFTDRIILAARPDNSVSYFCAPSWRFTNGTIDDQRYFDQKWIVTQVDHEGTDAAFGAGRLQGRHVLDAGRALINFQALGLSTTKPMVMLSGYSGGAGAIGWAASLASTYAPEFNIVGAAYGGIPSDLAAISRYVDGGLYAGLGFLGAFGLAQGYSAVADRFRQILTADGMADWKVASTKCLSDAFYTYAGKKFQSSTFSSDGAAILNDTVLAPVLNQVTLGLVASETPKFPQLLYNGVIDQIIPIASVDLLVQRFCANGANLLYRRTQLADHFADVSDADVVPFVAARFARTAFPAGCRQVSALFPWMTTNPAFATPIQIGRQRSWFGWNAAQQAKADEIKAQDNSILNGSASKKKKYLRQKAAQLTTGL